MSFSTKLKKNHLFQYKTLRDLVVALDAHQSKRYHLGMGRAPIAKTTFAAANQNRDYRIFEEFAFFMMKEARNKRAVDIFKLKGHIYAFDSTTIPLCLSVFLWVKFRKKKGGVKVHFLYDLEAQFPAYYITTASVYDSMAMSGIPFESGSYYVFDRGYNAFVKLYRIHKVEFFFVVRAKKKLQFKCVKNGDITPQVALAKNSPFPSPMAIKVKINIDILHESILPAVGAGEYAFEGMMPKMVVDDTKMEL